MGGPDSWSTVTTPRTTPTGSCNSWPTGIWPVGWDMGRPATPRDSRGTPLRRRSAGSTRSCWPGDRDDPRHEGGAPPDRGGRPRPGPHVDEPPRGLAIHGLRGAVLHGRREGGPRASPPGGTSVHHRGWRTPHRADRAEPVPAAGPDLLAVHVHRRAGVLGGRVRI